MMSLRRRMNAAASRPAIVRARAGEDRRPPVSGKSSPPSRAPKLLLSSAYPNPHSGLDFTGRAEPTAAELAPTAQQRDVGGSGRYWGSSPGERAHDERNRADDTGCGESVSLSAESGQLQFPARLTPLATGPPQTDPTFCATSKRSSIEMAATRRPTSFTTGTRLT